MQLVNSGCSTVATSTEAPTDTGLKRMNIRPRKHTETPTRPGTPYPRAGDQFIGPIDLPPAFEPSVGRRKQKPKDIGNENIGPKSDIISSATIDSPVEHTPLGILVVKSTPKSSSRKARPAKKANLQLDEIVPRPRLSKAVEMNQDKSSELHTTQISTSPDNLVISENAGKVLSSTTLDFSSVHQELPAIDEKVTTTETSCLKTDSSRRLSVNLIAGSLRKYIGGLAWILSGSLVLRSLQYMIWHGVKILATKYSMVDQHGEFSFRLQCFLIGILNGLVCWVVSKGLRSRKETVDYDAVPRPLSFATEKVDESMTILSGDALLDGLVWKEDWVSTILNTLMQWSIFGYGVEWRGMLHQHSIIFSWSRYNWPLIDWRNFLRVDGNWFGYNYEVTGLEYYIWLVVLSGLYFRNSALLQGRPELMRFGLIVLMSMSLNMGIYGNKRSHQYPLGDLGGQCVSFTL